MGRRCLCRPVEELADVMRRFVRSHSVRRIAVELDPRLDQAGHTTIAGFEHHADNGSPWMFVRLRGAGDDDGAWEAAVDALREQHVSMREAGAPLAASEARPLDHRGPGNFSAQLLMCLAAVREPAEGLTVVLTLPEGKPPEPWLSRLHDMAGSETLKALRWVIVGRPSEALAKWAEQFDDHAAIHHRAIVESGALVAELTEELDAEEARGVAGRGARPRGVSLPPLPRRWRPPTKRNTRPPSRPPSHPPSDVTGPPAPMGVAPAANQPPPEPPNDQAVADAEIRVRVARAAVAMKDGNGPQALEQQAAARDRARDAGQPRRAISLELMLGAYLVDLGQYRLASETFTRAATDAIELDAPELAAEAFVAGGSAETLNEDPVQAVRCYRHAIAEGKRAERPAIVLRAYWEAGQRALALGLEVDCIGLWGDAVVYAESVPPMQRKNTPAKDIAEGLSELLARHRRFAHAREVERRAEAF